MSRSRVLLGMTALCIGHAGCSLVLDFPELPPRDGGVDGTAAACAELEPNDALEAPSPIAPGTYALAICPAGEHDFFSFNLAVNQDVTIEVTFAEGGEDGDLDMRLYRESDGAVMSESEGFSTTEQIAHVAADGDQLAEGTYVVEVFPFADTIGNDYSLVLTITAGPMVDAGMIDAPL